MAPPPTRILYTVILYTVKYHELENYKRWCI